MCGIIGFISNKNTDTKAGKEIIQQYQDQHSRGSKGFGLIEVFKNVVNIERATEPVKALLDTRLSQAPVGLFHHRMPTSTENHLEQTHPFLISHDELKNDYLVIHNGVIRNHSELFKKHTEELGYTYATLTQQQYTYSTTPSYYNKYNDSETLAIEIARYFDGKSEVINALGTIAFVAIVLDKKTKKATKMLWGRNSGNPLDFLVNEKGILIASDIYHENTESIAENTFESFDLQAYFKAKTKINLLDLISTGKIKFKPEPVIETTIARHTGFTIPSTTQPTSVIGKTFNIADDDIDDDLSAREKAFKKMASRVIEDMEDVVYSFFENLAYEDASIEDCMQLANDFNDLLIEKIELAKDKVRPHFDRIEDEDKDTLRDEILFPNHVVNRDGDVEELEYTKLY